MRFRPGYLGSRRPGDAENFVWFQKKCEPKGENGMSDLKKIGKMGCKVAKNERNPDQGDDEDALHYIQQRKN